MARHDDPAALAAMAVSSHVLASTAGPFGEIGELTVAAAVASGRHYLDSTGEVDFMASTFARHDRAARQKELVVMNACAFEYVVGDCLCALAMADHPQARELRVSYWMPDKAATRGTARSALRILTGPAGRASAGSAVEIDFPDPAGRRWAVPYAGGEVELVRRRDPSIRVTTLMDMPPLMARGSGVLPVIAPLLRLAPLRAALDGAIQRLPEGPDDDRRAAQRWVILVEVDPGRGGREGIYATGTDPYGLTGEILARVAGRVLRGEHRATGVVAPAEAFEPAELLASISDLGVEVART
ncbi:MAG: hypothetical protein ABR573_07175 [Candidatus Dormibacteria bacterium]